LTLKGRAKERRRRRSFASSTSLQLFPHRCSASSSGCSATSPANCAVAADRAGDRRAASMEHQEGDELLLSRAWGTRAETAVGEHTESSEQLDAQGWRNRHVPKITCDCRRRLPDRRSRVRRRHDDSAALAAFVASGRDAPPTGCSKRDSFEDRWSVICVQWPSIRISFDRLARSVDRHAPFRRTRTRSRKRFAAPRAAVSGAGPHRRPLRGRAAA
jgi:hypothetical protein